jgi:hypothetical protein
MDMSNVFDVPSEALENYLAEFHAFKRGLGRRYGDEGKLVEADGRLDRGQTGKIDIVKHGGANVMHGCRLTIESYGNRIEIEAPPVKVIRDVMRHLADVKPETNDIIPPDLKTTAIFGECFSVVITGDGEPVEKVSGDVGFWPDSWRVA